MPEDRMAIQELHPMRKGILMEPFREGTNIIRDSSGRRAVVTVEGLETRASWRISPAMHLAIAQLLTLRNRGRPLTYKEAELLSKVIGIASQG
jgi:hypothetical protein